MARQRPKVEVRGITTPTARYQDIVGEIATKTKRFRELIQRARADRFTLLVHDDFNTETIESNFDSVIDGIRGVFVKEAEKIAADLKRRFNVTLDAEDVDGD